MRPWPLINYIVYFEMLRRRKAENLSIGEEEMKTPVIEITAAQLKTSGTIPIPLEGVEAPGAGFTIVPKYLYFAYIPGLEGFADIQALFLRLGDELIAEIEVPFDGTTGKVFRRAIDSGIASTEDAENIALTLRSDGDWSPTDGDGSGLVVITYDIERTV